MPPSPQESAPAPNARQRFVVELAAGTALYAIILALFDDLTDLIHTSSALVTLALAVVLYALTALTFATKGRFTAWHIARGAPGGRGLRGFGLWLILFSSKFVFLWVIETLFPRNVEVSSFLGLMAVIAAFTITDRVARLVYARLSD